MKTKQNRPTYHVMQAKHLIDVSMHTKHKQQDRITNKHKFSPYGHPLSFKNFRASSICLQILLISFNGNTSFAFRFPYFFNLV